MKPRLLVLGGEGESTQIVAHALRRRFDDFLLVLEQSRGGWEIARGRARRLGWVEVLGQVLFVQTAYRWLRFRSRARLAEIDTEFGLDRRPVTGNVRWVRSVNSAETVRLLKEADPELVVVNGTRILSAEVLGAIRGRFLNLHAGITPAFRGGHGGYWALAAGRPELAGVTVHWIDAGIDTGSVVKQGLIHPGPRDNFATYSSLQLGAGLPLLITAIEEYFAGTLIESGLPNRSLAGSRLCFHPTLWFYLAKRFGGVK
ncbi:MAG: formyl transferase [Terracidiphilus sp.]